MIMAPLEPWILFISAHQILPQKNRWEQEKEWKREGKKKRPINIILNKRIEDKDVEEKKQAVLLG